VTTRRKSSRAGTWGHPYRVRVKGENSFFTPPFSHGAADHGGSIWGRALGNVPIPSVPFAPAKFVFFFRSSPLLTGGGSFVQASIRIQTAAPPGGGTGSHPHSPGTRTTSVPRAVQSSPSQGKDVTDLVTGAFRPEGPSSLCDSAARAKEIPIVWERFSLCQNRGDGRPIRPWWSEPTPKTRSAVASFLFIRTPVSGRTAPGV
jgi:hypothetical protein